MRIAYIAIPAATSALIPWMCLTCWLETTRISRSSGRTDNSFVLLNIHKSKGLEYNICYFSGLSKKINDSDIKSKFLVDSNYNIITPYINDGIKQNIYKDLYIAKENQNTISEKIRLFYVALTRSKKQTLLLTVENNKSIFANELESDYKYLMETNTELKRNIYKCPKCSNKLKWYHNIPVFSYLFLRGKVMLTSKQRAQLRGMANSIDTIIIVDNIKTHTDKRGNDMAFISGSDETNSIEYIVFSDVFSTINDTKKGDILLIRGKVEKRNNNQIVVQKVKKIS